MERVALNYLKLAIFGALLLSATVLTCANMELKPDEMKVILEEVIIKEESNNEMITNGVKCLPPGASCVSGEYCCGSYTCSFGNGYCTSLY
ncbi:hypothetical protein BVRB_7g173020 [Beta vulgaris subsp. vulgaris]|nr:hypothetical protein BVRB_7g173020 [Beta vulgaris subsp. vulgaris]